MYRQEYIVGITYTVHNVQWFKHTLLLYADRIPFHGLMMVLYKQHS